MSCCRTSCFAFIPVVLLVISALLTLSGLYWCNLFAIEPIDGFENLPTFKTGVILWGSEVIYDYIGPSLQVSDTCSFDDAYPSFDHDMDNKWIAAVALQIFAAVVALILAIILGVAAFTGFRKNAFRFLGATVIVVCCTCTGLIYLVKDSQVCRDNPFLADVGVSQFYQNECRTSKGSISIYCTIVCFFCTGLITCFLPGIDIRKNRVDAADTENAPAQNNVTDTATEEQATAPPEVKLEDTEEYAVAVVGYYAAENYENEEASGTQQDGKETRPFSTGE